MELQVAIQLQQIACCRFYSSNTGKQAPVLCQLLFPIAVLVPAVSLTNDVHHSQALHAAHCC